MCLQIIDDHTDQNCCIPAREALILTSLDLADLKSITLLRYAFFPFLSYVLGCFRDFCSCFCWILILEGLYVLSSVRLHFQGATGQWQESMTWLAKVAKVETSICPCQATVQSTKQYGIYNVYMQIRHHTISYVYIVSNIFCWRRYKQKGWRQATVHRISSIDQSTCNGYQRCHIQSDTCSAHGNIYNPDRSLQHRTMYSFVPLVRFRSKS